MMSGALDAFGSFRVKGKRFDVLEVRGPVFGPTHHSQRFASAMGAICYVECHLNASTSRAANWAEVITTGTTDKARAAVEKQLGFAFTSKICAIFGHEDRGVREGGRGAGNIYRTSCPAILTEPGFLSNLSFFSFCRSAAGSGAIGMALADAIAETFPKGGLVALRLGHAYRGESGETLDAGAPVPGGYDPDPAHDSEIELAALYMQAALAALVDYK